MSFESRLNKYLARRKREANERTAHERATVEHATEPGGPPEPTPLQKRSMWWNNASILRTNIQGLERAHARLTNLGVPGADDMLATLNQYRQELAALEARHDTTDAAPTDHDMPSRGRLTRDELRRRAARFRLGKR